MVYDGEICLSRWPVWALVLVSGLFVGAAAAHTHKTW